MIEFGQLTRPSGPKRFDKPQYRLLMRLGLFHPARAVHRWYYRMRSQRCALAGKGLVPEGNLTACYVDALRRLHDLNAGGFPGDYLEFGVCYGSSMACMHDALVRTGTGTVRLFGFDSFQGMPPEADHQDNQLWSRGQLRSSMRFARKLLARRGVDWERTFLIKGWFRDTLVPDLIRRHRISRVGMIMIDCDIYTSARDALAFCEPMIADHAVILFDDWHAGDLATQNLGEKRAFDEFLRRNPRMEATPLPAYSETSAVFLLSRIPPDGR